MPINLACESIEAPSSVKLRLPDSWTRSHRTPGEAPASRSLRFCFVSNFTPDHNSGAAASIQSMGEALEQLGHTARFRWKEQPGSHSRHATITNLLQLPRIQYRQVKEELRQATPDVIVISQPFSPNIYEKLAPQYRDTIFLNLTHGWEHRYDIANRRFDWGENFNTPRGMVRRIAMAARARACRRTALAMDGFLSPSSGDGDFLVSHYGVSPDRLALIPYGLDREIIAADPSFGQKRRRRMIFYGQYTPRKGTLVLEKVLPNIAQRFTDAHLTFIVQGQAIPRIEQKFRRAFGNRLHLYPWMERSEALRICRQHDVFLFPSMLEGFGKTFLEAMACGLCVVGYAEGGLQDLARNGSEAFYCERGDETHFHQQLVECLSNPELAASVGARACAKARRYTWLDTAREIEGFCRERLAAKRAQ